MSYLRPLFYFFQSSSRLFVLLPKTKPCCRTLEALQGRKTAGKGPRPSSSTGTTVLTRKRRLIQQTEADLAIGIAPYWEAATVIADQGTDDIRTADREPSQKSGTRRRSRRGVCAD